MGQYCYEISLFLKYLDKKNDIFTNYMKFESEIDYVYMFYFCQKTENCTIKIVIRNEIVYQCNVYGQPMSGTCYRIVVLMYITFPYVSGTATSMVTRKKQRTN